MIFEKGIRPIDFVITWVDGNDPGWLNERAKYLSGDIENKQDVAGKDRYTDNGLLRYLFRGIAKFAPWVHKIYFVTWGHLPDWLNICCDRLSVVRHDQFIPSKFLPTFNSGTIALNLHRIPGLSEQFVYFNDDMYLLSLTSPQLFFDGKSGLPRDMAVQEVFGADAITSFWDITYHDIILLNQTYIKKEAIKRAPGKWLSYKYGRHFFKNLCLLPYHFYSAFYEPHLPASYQKTAFSREWQKHPKELDEACSEKFRTGKGVSENYIRFSQMALNAFVPINKDRYGFYASMEDASLPKKIASGRWKYVCINDNGTEESFKKVKDSFEQLLPSKCPFEL